MWIQLIGVREVTLALKPIAPTFVSFCVIVPLAEAKKGGDAFPALISFLLTVIKSWREGQI